MKSVLVEVVADAAAVVVISIGATALAALGLRLEQAGLASLTAGELVVGLWYVYMGVVVLFVAVYLIGYRALLPRVETLVSGTGGRTE